MAGNKENMDKNTENTENKENKENKDINEELGKETKESEENSSSDREEKNDEAKDDKKEVSETDTLKEKLKEEEDKYKRLLAEFDNYRKRTEKEKLSMFDFGASQILTKILPIIDNIERAIESVKEEDKNNSVYEGLDKIYKQVSKVLEEIDVKPIEALNKKFDANLHNAVMTDEESEAEVDTITEELQKGYTYKGDVIRHSMVKVKK